MSEFEKPDRYAVMGNPIAHSLSPAIHAEFARLTGQGMTYEAILVEPGGLARAIGCFRASGGKGLNITLPFKRQAWALVDSRSERAERAGAVNTIAFDADGRSFGDNTDGPGLVRDLVENLGVGLRSRRVLLLGAGGAVRGVLGPILDEQPAEIVIANRTADKARDLARVFSTSGFAALSGCGLSDLRGRAFDVVINGTSASLRGEIPSLPGSIVAPGGWCYDMVYGARPTPFMEWATAHGAAGVADGLGMLVEQAAVSFELWRGVRPRTGPVIAWLRGRLAAGRDR
jgi:shikimate dehydrogenase